MQTKEQMELFGMLQTGSLICLAASMRQESRGGHYRSDYPQTMELWRKHLILKK
jgi:L-aspartate oxidase